MVLQRPGRVLIVRDDADERQQLKTVLEAEGYRVSLAEDSQLVVETLLHDHCDVILLDLALPHGEGFEVLEKLQSEPAFRHIPVIVLSSANAVEDLNRGLEMGASDYVTYLDHATFLKARLHAALAAHRLKEGQLDQARAVQQLIRAAGKLRSDSFDASSLDGVVARSDALGQLGRLIQELGQELSAPGKSPAALLEDLQGELLRSLELQQAHHDQAGRVLVVDHDAQTLQATVTYLRELSYQVETAADGLQALALLESRPCDIVLSELDMPGLDGYALIARLKADSRFQGVPVIVVSVNRDPDSMARSIEAGAADHLRKPFNPLLLAARMRVGLVGKRLRDQELAYLAGVTTLTQAAAAMEEENFDPDSLTEVARGNDSLGRLARVFQRMAQEVLTRQQSLKHQVNELKAELDDARQRGKLAASTQTDYFHDLAGVVSSEARVMAFISFRGGTGKSNIVANLGVMLASAGCKVGLVDAAIHAPGLHAFFGLSSHDLTHTLQDFLFERCDIQAVTMDLGKQLNLLNRFSLPPLAQEDEAPRPPAAAETAATGKLLLIPGSNQLSSMARLLRQGYEPQRLTAGLQGLVSEQNLDFLLLDTQAGLNEEVLLTLLLADTVVILLRPDQQDYEGTGVLVQVAQKLKVPRIELLVNEAPPQQMSQLKLQIRETFGSEVLGVLPIVEEMISSGGLYAQTHPDHEVTLALREVARKLLH